MRYLWQSVVTVGLLVYLVLGLWMAPSWAEAINADSSPDAFQTGLQVYREGQYDRAVMAFYPITVSTFVGGLERL